jgi:peptide/nickel transport system substrate-binding protein
MHEQDLRELIAAVKAGRVSRRTFAHRMIGLGLTVPFASQLLAQSRLGAIADPNRLQTNPSRRRRSAKDVVLAGADLAQPAFRCGRQGRGRGGDFYEPLAAWEPNGNLVPVLAAEIPDIENGGLAADSMSVIWKLKKGVQWHDGQPFTADEVMFNWDYASDPATAATTIGSYQDVEVEKLDSFTVRVRFEKPTPFWAGSANGLIIPKHLFEPYKGANSREAPANLKPVGTGPYRIGSSTSSPVIWSKASAIPSTMCLTGRISIRSS